MQKRLIGTSAQRMNHYAFAIVLTLASAETSHAIGFLLPNQDPEAMGRGNAFAATADNPSAIYYDPAGITQLPGAQVSLGLYGVSAYSSVTSGSNKAHTDPTPQFAPQVYAVNSFDKVPISVGLGVYTPYGFDNDWGVPPSSPQPEKGNLTYVTVNPVVAWKICKMLSVAAGVTVNYADFSFQESPGIGLYKFSGNDWEPGFNIGILFHPHPMWSFGVNYHSETDMTFSGKSMQSGVFTESVDTSTKINFPQTVVGGISFRPTPKWNLEFDLSWTQWSKLGQINLPIGPFGLPQSLALNYRDSFIYNFGVTRELGKGYYASVGYTYSEDSSPSADFLALVPDADLSMGSFGLGHRGKHLDWGVAYQFAYYGGRNVNGDAHSDDDGIYKIFNNAVNASVTVKF